jgi:hypothetical protein
VPEPWLVIDFDAAWATASLADSQVWCGRAYDAPMRAYALVELGDSEAIDLREEDAERALEECLRDEPQRAGLLSVEEIELDECELSAN